MNRYLETYRCQTGYDCPLANYCVNSRDVSPGYCVGQNPQTVLLPPGVPSLWGPTVYPTLTEFVFSNASMNELRASGSL